MPARKRRSPEPPATISDARAIKALAHPARLAVLEELRVRDELTATECAEQVGLSPSAMSYHLRALQKWGFVEPAAPGSDGRERPWRLTSRSGWSFEATTEAALSAEDALMVTSFDRLRGMFREWSAIEPHEPKEWRSVATLSTSAVWLTAAEAKELVRLYNGFLESVRARTAHDKPEDARRMRTTLVVVPGTQSAPAP